MQTGRRARNFAGRPRELAAVPHSVGCVTGDIETRADCDRLVRAFYSRALGDPIIGFIFADIAKLDLELHVPVIASFWESVLLGARTYTGNAFRPHAALNDKVRLRPGHFERWLYLWDATVDELFAGARADRAKAHAQRVAGAFHRRLEAPPESTADAEDFVLTLLRSRD